MVFIGKSIFRKFLFFYLLLSFLIAAVFFYLSKQNFNFTVEVVGIILVIVIIYGLFLYYFLIYRPLKIVLEQIQALLVGKAYKKIFTNKIDEIGILAHFFNQVTKSFHQVSQDIQEKDRMESELSIASQLQRDILPLKTPFIQGLQIVAKTKPATEVGGDNFNFVNVNNRVYIYIGDVTGHGVAAGLIMTMVHSLINVFSEFCTSAYEIVVNVNKYIKSHVKKTMFMTMVMLCWDNTSKKMTFVGAGHEHILIYRTDSGECEAILSGGVALGMVPDNSKVIKEQSLDLNNGDLVVLYSDGIIEARNTNEEMFGLERLKQLVIEFAPQYGAEGINYHIANEVVNFMQGTVQADDMTLIVIKRDDSQDLQQKPQEQTTNW